MSFNIELKNPGTSFNIALTEIVETVYVGPNWSSRYLGVTPDNTLYVGDLQLQ